MQLMPIGYSMVTFNRQVEIEEWLSTNGRSETSWVAIDDDVYNFMPGAPLLLCTDRFGEQEAEILKEMLRA